MKIYTKTGDNGTTGLYGGKRVFKDELRIEAYGTLDELNSHLGLIATFELNCVSSELFQKVQSILFDMGAHLAADPEKSLNLPELVPGSVQLLEDEIDRLDAGLPQLRTFILPGGSYQASQCHLARTVCRRAERRIVALDHGEKVDPFIITFTNRLSDYLFVLARAVNLELGSDEIPWIPAR